MYVYRFTNKIGEIIYVGKTQNIRNRMKQHFGTEGHLPSECYVSTEIIEYIELPSKIDMDIKELYYINKWKPVYNKQNKQEDILTVTIKEDDDWIYFKSKEDQYIEDLERKNKELIFELEEFKYLLNNYQNKIINLKEENELLEKKNNMNNLNKEHTFTYNENEAKKKRRRFTFDEIQIIYKYTKEPAFLSSIKINGVERYKVAVYNSNDEIYLKELLTEKTVVYNKFSVKDYAEMVHLLSACYDFEVSKEMAINKLEEILLKNKKNEILNDAKKEKLSECIGTKYELYNKISHLSVSDYNIFLSDLYQGNDDTEIDIEKFIDEWIHNKEITNKNNDNVSLNFKSLKKYNNWSKDNQIEAKSNILQKMNCL